MVELSSKKIEWRESFRGGWEIEEDGSIFFILIDPKTGKIVSTEIWSSGEGNLRETHDIQENEFTRIAGSGETGMIRGREMTDEEIKKYKESIRAAISKHPDVRVKGLAQLYTN